MSRADILVGEAAAVLATLPAGSVHMIATSPPYWNLRDYDTDDWAGGDPDCRHAVQRWDGPKQTQGAQSAHAAKADRLDRAGCVKCGAIRSDQQLGLEPTPEEYVERLAGIFREAYRVLRDDGTLWLNLGNTYSGSGKGAVTRPNPDTKEAYIPTVGDIPGAGKASATWPAKCLVPIAWLVTLRLIQDGWLFRADVIWHKPNGMPSSVEDRPSISHEYILLFSKRQRYYYDGIAIAEPVSDKTEWTYPQPDKAARAGITTNGLGASTLSPQRTSAERNKRSVWSINTYAFPDAHFATFPPKLVEPMILAGTSEKGCCSACGTPWRRVAEKGELRGEARIQETERPAAHVPNVSESSLLRTNGRTFREIKTIGWQPSCKCAADVVPCTVLDIFAGSGTTGLVAIRNRRDFVGIELSPTYAAMARRRMQTTVRMDLE